MSEVGWGRGLHGTQPLADLWYHLKGFLFLKFSLSVGLLIQQNTQNHLRLLYPAPSYAIIISPSDVQDKHL